MKLYLASKSPRRRELLTLMGVDFDLIHVDTPEIVQPKETPYAYSHRVTLEKLHAARAHLDAEKLPILPILTADTEVILDGDILGKPANEEEGIAMLRRLSNRTHQVLSSVAIGYQDIEVIKTNETLVHFAPIPEKAINEYIQSGDYLDKSGGYGIQSYIGQYVTGIEGCFFSIRGLPLYLVRGLLEELQEQL